MSVLQGLMKMSFALLKIESKCLDNTFWRGVQMLTLFSKNKLKGDHENTNVYFLQ